MASIEYVTLQPHEPTVLESGVVEWIARGGAAPILKLPQIFWADGVSWGEANCWALQMRLNGEPSSARVRDILVNLLSYANWLEAEKVAWWHFPARASDRCLVRYRGELIRARDAGTLARSTAKKKMAVAIKFYRWIKHRGMIDPEWPMWAERQVGIRLSDRFGFTHTMRVTSTDLAIKHRKTSGAFNLEEGLMPVTSKAMQEILRAANDLASEEIALMLTIGFLSGMRIGSICDLKTASILRAVPDLFGTYRIALGPSARPPVKTKGGKPGAVPCPSSLIDRLKAYITSTRRLKRVALADRQHKDLLFLTKLGKPFADQTTGTVGAVNEAMSRLRKASVRQGNSALRGFKFHQSRATFATNLMKIALDQMPSKADAVRFVREALMHKDEATTMGYVHFLETSAAMVKVSKEFSDYFMGIGSAASP